MKQFLTKISFIILITTIFTSCSIIKHLEGDQHLLEKNVVTVQGEKSDGEYDVQENIIKPKPNKRFLKVPMLGLPGIPLRLNIYNLSNKNPDSTFNAWLHRKPKREKHLNNILSKKQTYRLRNTYLKINDWFRKSGEPIALVDSTKINNSIDKLKKYYDYNGWHDIDIDYTIDYLVPQKGTVNYNINKGTPYVIDSLTTEIDSKVVDSIYQLHEANSLLKIGEQSNGHKAMSELNRITFVMRNNGLYTFAKEQTYYQYDPDSIQKTTTWNLVVNNKRVRNHDSIIETPFKVFKISEVNVFTDFDYENKGKAITDSITYNNHNFYSFDKQRFKPKALSDVISIQAGDVYRDLDKSKTLNQLNNLKTFKNF